MAFSCSCMAICCSRRTFSSRCRGASACCTAVSISCCIAASIRCRSSKVASAAPVFVRCATAKKCTAEELSPQGPCWVPAGFWAFCGRGAEPSTLSWSAGINVHIATCYWRLTPLCVISVPFQAAFSPKDVARRKVTSWRGNSRHEHEQGEHQYGHLNIVAVRASGEREWDLSGKTQGMHCQLRAVLQARVVLGRQGCIFFGR